MLLARDITDDPEPEFVKFNRKDIAAVTLQGNNHVVLIDLRKGKAIRDWPLGSVDLTDIDIKDKNNS